MEYLGLIFIPFWDQVVFSDDVLKLGAAINGDSSSAFVAVGGAILSRHTIVTGYKYCKIGASCRIERLRRCEECCDE